ncbi:hypothetical protein [Methanobrevibacter sp. DSM 116169]|uniref:hypothetical protein n=1 Tax=Methanobrevibacter sp. DSM 116169 TaxID=3242727 RepID=UPI0038FC9535
MKENHQVIDTENVIIDDNSKIVFASDFGVGISSKELRLILINQKLVNGEDDSMKLINESNMQIIMAPETALNLKNILADYLDVIEFKK